MPPSARPGQPRREISRPWFAAITVAWLLVVLVSLWSGLARPTPTDRDQTTVAAARPVVDEAIARVATVVTDRGGVVAVSAFEPTGSCDITVFRGGERYHRTLTAVVAPGTETDLLQRVAAALPREYHPVVRGGDQPRLTADAGYWVLLTASVPTAGEVRFVADTGGIPRPRFGECRPRGDLDESDPAPAVPSDVVPGVLARLGVTGNLLTTATVSCVEGGAIGTVEVRAGAYAGDLSRALAEPAPGMVVAGGASLFAYRTATAQVAVRAHEDATIVTVTTVDC
jgi:hypothetical protein